MASMTVSKTSTAMVFEAVVQAVSVSVGVVGIALTGIEHAVLIEVLGAVQDAVAIGVGIRGICGVRPPKLDAVREAVTVRVRAQRGALADISFTVSIEILFSIERPVTVGVWIQGTGLPGITPTVSIDVLETVHDSITVRVITDGVCFPRVDDAVAVAVLFTVEQSVPVGVHPSRIRQPLNFHGVTDTVSVGVGHIGIGLAGVHHAVPIAILRAVQ